MKAYSALSSTISSKWYSITSAISFTVNPATTYFTLKFVDTSAQGRAVVSIFNSNGYKVMEYQTEKMSDELLLKEIPVNNLQPGVYVIQILMNQKDQYTTKIIVAK
jgi:methionine-rich copper-binding protein CopC